MQCALIDEAVTAAVRGLQPRWIQASQSFTAPCPFAKTVHENGAPVPRCYTCNAVGHIARDCPQLSAPGRTRSPPPRRLDRFSDDEGGRPRRDRERESERPLKREQSPGRERSLPLPPPPPSGRGDLGCFICHEAGHFARDCPERGGPRDPRADDYLRSRGYGLGVGPGMVGPSMAYAGYRAPLGPPKPRRGEAVCYERGRDEDRKEALLNHDLEDYMKAKPAKDRDYENGYRGEQDVSEGRQRETSIAGSREGSSERKRDGSVEPRKDTL